MSFAHEDQFLLKEIHSALIIVVTLTTIIAIITIAAITPRKTNMYPKKGLFQ